jgi:hypothetical protein
MSWAPILFCGSNSPDSRAADIHTFYLSCLALACEVNPSLYFKPVICFSLFHKLLSRWFFGSGGLHFAFHFYLKSDIEGNAISLSLEMSLSLVER